MRTRVNKWWLSGTENARVAMKLAAGVLLLSAVACGSGSNAMAPTATTGANSTPAANSSSGANANAASIPLVSISAREYAYDAPDTLPAGITRIQMQNAGQEDHQAQLLKLNSGVTLAQFQTALQGGPDKALSLVTAQGGPNAEKPGQSAESVQNLQPGQYVFICFVPAADGVPHLAKGMIKPVQVTEATQSPVSQLPSAPTTITAHDFLFDGATSLPAGQATINFKNGGSQPHEMSLIKLNPGVTLDQLKAALSSGAAPSGPPPFTSEGGMGGIVPGATGQTTVNLTSGTYALICNIPDPATGKPHVALGMFAGFTVP